MNPEQVKPSSRRGNRPAGDALDPAQAGLPASGFAAGRPPAVSDRTPTAGLPLDVLQVITTIDVGGAETHLLSLCQGLVMDQTLAIYRSVVSDG